MKDERNSIFRAKTVEAVQSPEVLDQYLKVTSPGVWIFLAAVICLLIGVVIWGVFGSIQTTLEVAVVVEEDNSGYCVVPYRSFQAVERVAMLSVSGQAFRLDTRGYRQNVLDQSTDPRILITGGLSAGDYVVIIPLLECPKRSGVFTGTVVTETLTPISLLLS